LSSAPPDVSSELNSAYINGLSVNSVKAGNNVELLKSSVKKNVEAILGHVQATSSFVAGNITAGSWVKLEKTSAQDIISFLSSVSSSNSNMQNIAANQDINLRRSTVQNRVYSTFGSVSALFSKLGSVYANGDIELTDSHAIKLYSSLGRVTIRQTNPQGNQPISQITALKDVEIDNCELQEVSCRQKAVITNCTLNNLFLYIDDPEEEAQLDLQGSSVKEKITIQSTPSLLNSIIATLFNLVWEGSTLPMSNFTLFVSGEEIPKNIEFAGFTSEDLSFEKVTRDDVQGTLVTGKKTISFLRDYGQKLFVL